LFSLRRRSIPVWERINLSKRALSITFKGKEVITMISGSALLSLFIQLVVAGLIFWVIWWGLGAAGIPEPFNKVIRVIVVVLVVIFLINLLLSLGGHPLIRWR